MRLVVAGKGGVGKTSITGTLARQLARSGRRVLAIDADANPNLWLTLGIDPAVAEALAPLPAGLAYRDEEGVKLAWTLDDIRRGCATTGPDGVELVVMARASEANTGCLSLMHVTVRALVQMAATEPGEDCILDLEASTEHMTRGDARYADVILIVVEPYFTSMETGRRIAALAADLGVPRIALVANKVRDGGEAAKVWAFAAEHALELAAVIPFDAGLREAERAEIAPLEHDSQSPMVTAVGGLAEWLAGARRDGSIAGIV